MKDNRRQKIQAQRAKDLAKRQQARKLEALLRQDFNRIARWPVPKGRVA